MTLVVGIDVAKEIHWATVVVAGSGHQVISRRVANTPDAIVGFLDELAAAVDVHGPATVGIDVLGGIAGLITAMVLDTGHRLVHVPGIAVNRARQATRGGEHKSDPRDARVIADQLRLRDDWRPVTGHADLDIELNLLIARRRELVCDQTRRINRARDMLTGIFPGLERAMDLTNLSGLHLLARYATPDQIRRAGRARIIAHLRRNGVRADRADRLASAAMAAANQQHLAVPGQSRIAQFVREHAADLLAIRNRINVVDTEIAEVLQHHPDAALVQSMPGMGATLTAEFLATVADMQRFPTADTLAAASGLAPVLQQSGKVHYLRRATGGAKILKRVFYHSAFCAISTDPASKAFYTRKRTEGKRHQQALIALARRRVNVLHAILRTRRPYNPNNVRTPQTAA